MEKQSKWRASAMLLAASGLLVAALGTYFIFLRPPLLAEDIRYLGLSVTEARELLPRLTPWLTQVFRVLGGYALATGLLAATLAATSFRDRRLVAVLGAALAGASSIGLMVEVNSALHSDFEWLLAGIALLWALSLAAFVIESKLDVRRSAPSATRKGNTL